MVKQIVKRKVFRSRPIQKIFWLSKEEDEKLKRIMRNYFLSEYAGIVRHRLFSKHWEDK